MTVYTKSNSSVATVEHLDLGHLQVRAGTTTGSVVVQMSKIVVPTFFLVVATFITVDIISVFSV